MSDVERTNDTTARLIRSFGSEVAGIGNFAQEMVILEGVVAGIIGFNAARYNKHPDELTEALCAGIRERVTRLIYGNKQ
jgi:hypothetical protein